MKTLLYLMPLLLLAAPAQAGTREDVLAAMQRCAAIADDRTWLDCTYGAQQIMRARLGLPPAPAYQQRLVPPPAMAAPVAVAPALAPAPRVAAAPPPVEPRGGMMQILGGNAPPVAISILESVRYDSQGAFIMTLQNGEVWHQVNPGVTPQARFKTGAKVVIRPGALWSYNLKAEDNPHTYKVERKS